MTSVVAMSSLIKLAKQQIRILARSIVPAVSYWVGTNGFLLLAIRRSESMFVALDDWIRSGERKKWLVVCLGGPTRPDVGFSSAWRVGWQERCHARTQPARRTAG